MTVCIAALCENEKCLVAVSDNKVSFHDFSAENLAVKNDPLWSDWTAMYAGNDVSHVGPILDHAFDLLRVGWAKRKQPQRRRCPLEPKIIAEAIDAAWGWRLQQEIEKSVLRPFGFTTETFRNNGRRQCSTAQHADLCNRINSVDLGGLVFLLAGFDKAGNGHIWSIDGVSAPRNYKGIGMFAIGSGAKAALSTMAYHVDAGHVRFKYSSVEKVAYCVLTAKFMSESASNVGRSTFVVILRGGRSKQSRKNKIKFIKTPGIQVIRERWKNEGAPRFPTSFIATELGKLVE